MAISYVDHKIVDTTYTLHVKDSESIPVELSGGITVSQEELPGKIVVEYRVSIGSDSSAFCFRAKTRTGFAYSEADDTSEENIKANCIPVALDMTKDDIQMLLKDHGIENLVLPDFRE